MKKMISLLVLVLTVLGLTTNAQTNLPIFRAPIVSASFESNMVYWEGVAQKQTFPRHLILQENTDTDKTSAGPLGANEYFAVYVPNLPDKGTILKLDPLTVNEGGVEGYGVTLHDVINHVDYYVPFQYIFGGRMGTFTIAGQTIWLYIHYPVEFGWYPSMNLTWGDGSSANNPGKIYDDLSSAVVDDSPAPTNMELAIVNMVNVTNVPNGIYVAVNTKDEHYTLQSTTDFKVWKDEPQPFYIVGYVGLHYYSATDVAGNSKFFRSKR